MSREIERVNEDPAQKNVNLVAHIYGFLEAVIKERASDIPVLPSFPDVKELPEKLFIIEYTRSEPSTVSDGSIDLEMRWEIRFIKKIKDLRRTRHDVQEMAWKVGAMFHQVIIPNPYNPADGEPGFRALFMGAEDDNFDYEQKTFESWATELSIEARVERGFFEDL